MEDGERSRGFGVAEGSCQLLETHKGMQLGDFRDNQMILCMDRYTVIKRKPWNSFGLPSGFE